jgi:hypothetical protein
VSELLVGKRENQMNSIETRCRVYDPGAVNTMGWAFDKAFAGLSEESKRQPNMRRNLALCIIRLFDGGEHAPLRLSRMALALSTTIIDSDGKCFSNRALARSNLY